MQRQRIRLQWEATQGEGIKTTALYIMDKLGRGRGGQVLLERYAYGGRKQLQSTLLNTLVSGLRLEHPLMAGAGVDKFGRAVNGLYSLGFSAVEVGSVPLFAQEGNAKPRLWVVDARKGGSH